MAYSYQIANGLSYTINEFLYRNIPVITTPLPYLDEIGYKDGETGYIVEFDCSNVDDVAKKIKKIPKFKFEPLNDSYDDIFTTAKSHYAKDVNTMEWVVCTYALGFLDMEVNAWRQKGELWQVNKIRAYDLMNSKDNQGKPIQLVRLVKKDELKDLQEAWEQKQISKRI